jgi:hypothetical protein
VARFDRTAVEKDFPLVRRGYEPEAVDRHLRALADRLESQRSEPKTLASTASERVQSIIAAAEASAAEIRDEAEKQARAAAEVAEQHAEQVRNAATRQAEDYVAKVRVATLGMLERQQVIEDELKSIQEDVRAKGERIDRELVELTSGLDALTTGLGKFSAGTTTWRTDESGDTLRSREAGDEDAEGEPDFDDEEKARVVALDMALGGAPREEAERFLAENFAVEDRNALLDETYSNLEQSQSKR